MYTPARLAAADSGRLIALTWNNHIGRRCFVHLFGNFGGRFSYWLGHGFGAPTPSHYWRRLAHTREGRGRKFGQRRIEVDRRLRGARRGNLTRGSGGGHCSADLGSARQGHRNPALRLHGAGRRSENPRCRRHRQGRRLLRSLVQIFGVCWGDQMIEIGGRAATAPPRTASSTLDSTEEFVVDRVGESGSGDGRGSPGNQIVGWILLQPGRSTEGRRQRRQQHEIASLLSDLTRLRRGLLTHRAPSDPIRLKFETNWVIRLRTSWVRSKMSSSDQ